MKQGNFRRLAIFAISALCASAYAGAAIADNEWEWDSSTGYHEEEWYDPSDWFNDDNDIDYEADYYDGYDPDYYSADDYDYTSDDYQMYGYEGDDSMYYPDYYGYDYYTNDWYDNEPGFDSWWDD